MKSADVSNAVINGMSPGAEMSEPKLFVTGPTQYHENWRCFGVIQHCFPGEGGLSRGLSCIFCHGKGGVDAGNRQLQSVLYFWCKIDYSRISFNFNHFHLVYLWLHDTKYENVTSFVSCKDIFALHKIFSSKVLIIQKRKPFLLLFHSLCSLIIKLLFQGGGWGGAEGRSRAIPNPAHFPKNHKPW